MCQTHTHSTHHTHFTPHTHTHTHTTHTHTHTHTPHTHTHPHTHPHTHTHTPHTHTHTHPHTHTHSTENCWTNGLQFTGELIFLLFYIHPFHVFLTSLYHRRTVKRPRSVLQPLNHMLSRTEVKPTRPFTSVRGFPHSPHTLRRLKEQLQREIDEDCQDMVRWFYMLNSAFSYTLDQHCTVNIDIVVSLMYMVTIVWAL